MGAGLPISEIAMAFVELDEFPLESQRNPMNEANGPGSHRMNGVQ